MRHAGKWMVLFPLSSLLVFVVGVTANSLIHGLPFSNIMFLQVLILPLPLAFIGAALWLAGWIVEGFAQPDR